MSRSKAKTKKQSKEIASTEVCPCGSGKVYRQCCKKRDFRWERRPNGELLRTAPISPELMGRLQDAKDRFIEVFGRNPRQHDPIFFEKFYTSPEDFDRKTLQAMRTVGSPPSLVYAYRKTGRMVTTRNKGMLTPDELTEWESAIEEYYSAVEAGEEIDVFADSDELSAFLLESVRRNQIVGGSFINLHFNRYKDRNGSVASVESTVAFATINFVRSLKSIHILIENDSSYDAYHIIRSLYENYLVVNYVYKDKSRADIFDAQLGTILGTHAFARSKDGKQIQSEIVEIGSGKTIRIPSRWSMAVQSGEFEAELYDSVYRPLSSYSHSEITNVANFLSDDGYDYFKQDFRPDTLVTCHLISMLYFTCLANNSPCLRYLVGDLLMNAERSLFSLLVVQETVAEQGRAMPPIYEAAIANVTSGNARLSRIAEVFAAQTRQPSQPII